MNDTKAFIAIDHGTSGIDLRHLGKLNLIIARPIEIHHKSNGDLEDKPSFCIVMASSMITVAGEISLKMLNDGLADIGYKIVRK
ncbi:hypothetical protein LCGC14_0501170 [marine sediment metagenome]|uniref:Uncharacterized protein n=1 Tax=marine sediment metagenome TaxID=412755 RepID=A0A0F9SMD0_9ZZZZ|nr:hypothetical protein [Pricia sp.]